MSYLLQRGAADCALCFIYLHQFPGNSQSLVRAVHGGRYWDRTSDPFDVNEVLYR